MTNIIDMARKHLCRKRIDAAASNTKEGEKTTIEEPPKDLGATDNEPDADPEDTTEKPEDSPEPGRKKTRNGPFKRLIDNHPRVTTGIILGAMAFIIVCAITSVAYAAQIANDKLTDAINHISRGVSPMPMSTIGAIFIHKTPFLKTSRGARG